MSLNTIREVTEITGITVNALRYYDNKGLLHPTVRSPEGRKEWLYDNESVRRTKRILLLRRIGIPVESIAAVLDRVDKMDETILKSRLEELREETSLQRAMKKYILNGGDPGEAYAVLNQERVDALITRCRIL